MSGSLGGSPFSVHLHAAGRTLKSGTYRIFPPRKHPGFGVYAVVTPLRSFQYDDTRAYQYDMAPTFEYDSDPQFEHGRGANYLLTGHVIAGMNTLVAGHGAAGLMRRLHAAGGATITVV
jgi:hypothetical protein